MDLKCLKCKKKTNKNQYEYRNRIKVTKDKKQLKKAVSRWLKVYNLPEGYLCNR